MPSVSTSVICVKLSVSSLFHEQQLLSMNINPTILRQNLGDRQSSLLLISSEDPQLVLGGFEALVGAAAKRARFVWAAMFTSPDLIEPNAARDGHLLAMIGSDELIWR